MEGEYYWPAWHDQVKEMGNHYPRYVEIMNEAAILNGYQNAKQFYVRDYGSDRPNANQECDTSSDRMGRLHFQSTFLEICMHNDGTTFIISSCLLELPKMDVTDEMVKQGNTIIIYSTPLKMFQAADNFLFFQSIGFPLLTSKKRVLAAVSNGENSRAKDILR
ncbi:unnamed protein product [Orchesella dallaii]|uniref:Uncharacterized protein n=1 Tax=Orchesella dallaii TaxID=48710 RepID=A0ABP1QLA9_9HEXA